VACDVAAEQKVALGAFPKLALSVPIGSNASVDESVHAVQLASVVLWAPFACFTSAGHLYDPSVHCKTHFPARFRLHNSDDTGRRVLACFISSTFVRQCCANLCSSTATAQPT